MKRSIILLCLLMCCGTAFSQIYVKSTASGSNNGSSWTNAYTSLSTAITNATAGSTIWVAAGTYYLPTGSARTASFAISKSLTILGGFPATGNPNLSSREPLIYESILSGDISRNDSAWKSSTNTGSADRSDNAYSVVTISIGATNSMNVTLDGLVIQGGNANSASDGPAKFGAGIYLEKTANGSSTATINIQRCFIRYNTATHYAALGAYYSWVNSGTNYLFFNKNKVHDNQASTFPGLGWKYAGTNAGINHTVLVANSLFVRNYSTSSGITDGGINFFSGQNNNTSMTDLSYSFYNNTFNDNVINGSANGVVCLEGTSSSNGMAEAYAANNIFYGNGKVMGIYTRNKSWNFKTGIAIDHNMAEEADSFIVAGKKNIFGNPLLNYGNSVKRRLTPCSRAINAGTLNLKINDNSSLDITSVVGSYDAEENSRVRYSVVDIGAYESFDLLAGPTYSTINASVCGNDSIQFNGKYRKQAGEYYDTLVNAKGCDSFITLKLKSGSPNSFTYNQNICFGDSLLFNGFYRKADGSYKDTLVNRNGCDSFVTLNLVVNAKLTPVIQDNGNELSVAGGPYDSYIWYRNSSPISGATQATYTAAEGGAYTVRVSKTTGGTSCVAFSPAVNVFGTGIARSAMPEFRLYPNPASEKFWLTGQMKGHVRILSTDGRLLLRAVISDDGINVAGLPSGVMVVCHEESGSVAKFVKN